QLDLVQALEIGHFRRITRLDQGLEAGPDQLDKPAAEHGLLAEEVGLALLPEGGFDDPGPAAADRRRIGQCEIMSVARGVLVHREQAGHAAAPLILASYRVARALR